MTDTQVPDAAPDTARVPTRVLYAATVTVHGGREGRARSDDGRLDLQLAPPATMGGHGEKGTNPEQLFAAGYAGCFGSAVAAVARRRQIDPGTVSILARVGIGPLDERAFGLTVELVASLPDVDRATAESLVHEAHAVCPYSNATRGNVPVTLTITNVDGDA